MITGSRALNDGVKKMGSYILINSRLYCVGFRSVISLNCLLKLESVSNPQA